MHNEVSIATELCVVLIAMGVVICLIWYTVFMGNDMRTEGINESIKVTSMMTESALEDMVGEHNDMSTAAAYNILSLYGAMIPKCTCNLPINNVDGNQVIHYVQDLTKSTPCLLQRMHGKVSLEVKKEYNWYEVIIHNERCTWYATGVCNCDSLSDN